MSVETIRPDGTAFSSGSPSITGAASVHAAWNDDSDGSFVEFNATSDIVRVTFESPTIPAGALVSRVVVRARVWNVGSGNGPLRVAVGTPSGDDIWSIASTPTTVGEITIPQSVWPVSDLVTGLEVEIRTNQSAADVVIYELYADVYYVDQPTLTVDEPTGTVTDTNAPEVTWSGTLDSEGGAQTKAQVKVFDDATYGAGGFDPDSSTPTSTSGELAQATGSWTVDDTLLADDTYRAYVRIAQTVNGTTLWSDWAFSGFDIDVDLPGVPTLTLTADSANARIQIDLTDNAGVVSTDGFEVQRSLDGGVTWDSLRTELGDGLVATDDTTVYDYEAPNGTTVHYRARSRHDYGTLIASSAWASDSDSWSSTSWWLKHPNQPALNTAVVIRSFPKVDRAGRQGVFQGLGASFPVVVSDTRESKRGTVVLRSFSIDAQDALDAMLDTADTLLLQSPAGEGGPDYIQVLNHERARVIDQSDASRVFESLEFVQVDEALSIETSSGTLTTGGGFVSTFGTRLTAAEAAIDSVESSVGDLIDFEYPVELSQSVKWKWTPPSRAPFESIIWGTQNVAPADSTYNHWVGMGFNPGVHSGGDVVAGEPAWYMAFEDGYWDGVNQGAEWYVAYWSPDHTSVELFRPFYCRVLRDDNSQHSATIFCDIGTTDNGTFAVTSGDFAPIFAVSGTVAGGAFATVISDGNASLIIDGGNFGPFLQFKFENVAGFNLNIPNVDQLVLNDKNARIHAVFTQGASDAAAVTDLKSSLKVNGNLGFFGATPATKRTGWGAPTGTATRTTFATGTVTLPQLAERVKALLDDLTTYGLIGT